MTCSGFSSCAIIPRWHMQPLACDCTHCLVTRFTVAVTEQTLPASSTFSFPSQPPLLLDFLFLDAFFFTTSLTGRSSCFDITISAHTTSYDDMAGVPAINLPYIASSSRKVDGSNVVVHKSQEHHT